MKRRHCDHETLVLQGGGERGACQADVCDDEGHLRGVLAFVKPYKNVAGYELLPRMHFGESKYEFLGRVYDMKDFSPPTPETLNRLRAIIDEAFGRSTKPTEV